LEAVGISNKISIFSSTKTYGLGLYKTIPSALITEIVLLGIGIYLFVFFRIKTKSKKLKEINPDVSYYE